MEIVLIGLNHRTASLEMRERVAFNPEQALRASEELRTRGILEESLVLSTCNRSELYGVPVQTLTGTADSLEGFLTTFHHLRAEELDGFVYRHRDRDAVRHLFRVSAGLDSMMLGEAEILGQVREAYRAALEHGATGPVLNRMFQGALEVGKRVRAETEIGTRPMSVASAGIRLAEKIFGKLRGHSALILGAGAMGEQAVVQLRDRGISRVIVANRSAERGAELAKRVNGDSVPWEGLPEVLREPDILVTSVGGNERILTREMIARAMELRGNRSLFVIDLGMPRNVDGEVGSLYNVYLYNIDDLTEIVEQNKQARASEIPRAEEIIEEHVVKFHSWQTSLEAGALVDELRSKLRTESAEFLREPLQAMTHLSAADRERITRITEELVEHLVLNRAERLREERELRRKLQNLEALRDLFHLPREKP
ncbi:MAG TPA: glutamyl-tRNA reductase [Candidatus Dormibacteraeota bacterium]|nr:glutamyl-tRNA reductase [Candidatus Dormibacteraeota bacterium]